MAKKDDIMVNVQDSVIIVKCAALKLSFANGGILKEFDNTPSQKWFNSDEKRKTKVHGNWSIYTGDGSGVSNFVFVTSAKEVMFSSAFVCLFVC